MPDDGTTSNLGLYIRFQAAVLAQLPRPDQMDKDTMEMWIGCQGQLKESLAHVLIPVKAKSVRQAVLGTSSRVTLPECTDPFDPKEFFKTREGLYVWDQFRNRILAAAQEMKSFPVTEISSFDLVKLATDSEIRSEFPEGHVFKDAGVFCAYLAGLIEQQKNGGDGTLLNNSYANIFYVVGIDSEVFAVGVYWRSVNREWDVSAYRLDDRQRPAGRRAFSATADS